MSYEFFSKSSRRAAAQAALEGTDVTPSEPVPDPVPVQKSRRQPNTSPQMKKLAEAVGGLSKLAEPPSASEPEPIEPVTLSPIAPLQLPKRPTTYPEP